MTDPVPVDDNAVLQGTGRPKERPRTAYMGSRRGACSAGVPVPAAAGDSRRVAYQPVSRIGFRPGWIRPGVRYCHTTPPRGRTGRQRTLPRPVSVAGSRALGLSLAAAACRCSIPRPRALMRSCVRARGHACRGRAPPTAPARLPRRPRAHMAASLPRPAGAANAYSRT